MLISHFFILGILIPFSLSSSKNSPMPSTNSPIEEFFSEPFYTHDDPQNDYIFASMKENGITYEYIRQNGNEILKVFGKLPSEFDKESILEKFRRSIELNAKPESNDIKWDTLGENAIHPNQDPVISEKDESKSLLESFTQFILGSKKTTLQLFKDQQLLVHVEIAKEERMKVE